MPRTPLIFMIVVAIPQALSAQTDEEQVVAVAEALFDAMRSKDTAAIGRLMLPEARLMAVDETRSPGTVSFSGRDQFMVRIASSDVELQERMWSPKVEIDGNIASIWTPYDFHRDGAFSHCGVDGFHMVRIGGDWRIGHITYNRRVEGCAGRGAGSRERAPTPLHR